MTSIDALLAADATAQSLALQSGKLSAEALVSAQLRAIERLNPTLNCFVFVDAAGALAAARASDLRRSRGEALGPLDGLAVAMKDNIDVAGMPTTAGFGAVLHVATADAPVVAALRRAGCVLLGKLNMHEAALGSSNDNPHLGRCGNPYDPEFTPGGSSGGSGAAVAAALCAMALGSDTMGSVRIPAACCGVIGFKASVESIPTAGSLACCRRLDHLGPLTRSVRDLALFMPVLSRFGAFRDWAGIVGGAPATLRIGVATGLETLAPDPAVRAALNTAATALRDAGFAVEEQSLTGFDFGAVRRAGLFATEADVSVEHAPLIAERPEAVSAELTRLLLWVSGKSAVELARAEATIDAARQWLLDQLEEFDVLLWPTSPNPVFRFDEAHPATHADLTCVANMAGVPALSLPAGLDTRGFPLGVQLLGRPGADVALATLAAVLESALPALPPPTWHVASCRADGQDFAE